MQQPRIVRIKPLTIPTSFIVALSHDEEKSISDALHVLTRKRKDILVLDVHSILDNHPDNPANSSAEKVARIMLQDFRMKKRDVPGRILMRVLEHSIDGHAAAREDAIKHAMIIGTPHELSQVSALHELAPHAAIVYVGYNYTHHPREPYHGSIMKAVLKMNSMCHDLTWIKSPAKPVEIAEDILKSSGIK